MDASAPQSEALRTFVQDLVSGVIRSGGHIVHGNHPTITPLLLEQARLHAAVGRRDSLIIVTSRYWHDDPTSQRLLEHATDVALVYETPEVVGPNARAESLKQLREWMMARADAVVLAGGRTSTADIAGDGIPTELSVALDRGLPCFVLGGFGGAAEAIVQSKPQLLSSLKNGLSPDANELLCRGTNATELARIVLECLTRLPLVRGRNESGASFRILALDGGGIKGAFSAAALAAWEKATGFRIVDHFDLIAGTSTGGILALGLGSGLGAGDMLEFYRSSGPAIFPVMRLQGRWLHKVRHFFMPKYSQETLYRELRRGLSREGQPPVLRESKCRLLIPTYHALAGSTHVFRTPHHPDLTADANTEVSAVALATTAAPTYFAAATIPNLVSECSYFDGGVWANCPALAAVVEAVCFLATPIERIDLLSIGTTDEPYTAKRTTRAGIVRWAWDKRIVTLLQNAQQDSALRLTQQLVTRPRFLRVNFVAARNAYALDGVNDIQELAALGEREALEPDTLAQVKARFLNGIRAVPWQPFP